MTMKMILPITRSSSSSGGMEEEDGGRGEKDSWPMQAKDYVILVYKSHEDCRVIFPITKFNSVMTDHILLLLYSIMHKLPPQTHSTHNI